MKRMFRKISRRLTAFAAAAVCAWTAAVPAFAGGETDVFFEDFTGSELDLSQWRIAEKNWGGTVQSDGKTVDYNGGVIRENVSVQDGCLVLRGLGNQYAGELHGINRNGSRRDDGKRCGGAIATNRYFASGSYEIRAKIAPVLGCCSAMWTFEYEEDESGNITNHEIDIEFPGRDSDDAFSLSHALCTTWVTEEDYRTKSAACGAQADGKFHTYRFDWHTGDDTEQPRVEFYFDGTLTDTSYEYIPTKAGRFWLGLWFPKNWAGTPDFDTAEFVVDSVKITPFHEKNDMPQNETYSENGWAVPDILPPKGWLLWHSYTKYAQLDSKLYLRAPDGTVSRISGDFIHAMNGRFGLSPDRFVFMAIDPAADEWDLYLSSGGAITNLTQNSGFRNEDPEWSPDGRQIVFKRGRWDREADDFLYDLALLELSSGKVTMLTDDRAEEAMPCFSQDGKTIFYASFTDGIGSIMQMDPQTHNTKVIFHENGVNAYYPIVRNGLLHFTKWYSAENHCDQLMMYDGTDIRPYPFNSDRYDCSDACPFGDGGMIFSCTENGNYDLYCYDGSRAGKMAVSTDENDLGADFYAWTEYEAYLAQNRPAGDVNADGITDRADAVLLQSALLAKPDTVLQDWQAGDLNADGRLDARDLSLIKRKI